MPRDYYEVLGVGRDADLQAIKTAYRKLAVKYHPDRNPGDRDAEEHFKEAAEAYAVLSNADRRQHYDRFGHTGPGTAAGGGFDPSIFGDFSDILGDLFGFGSRRGARGGGIPGADLRYDLRLSFEEAAFGAEPTLRIPRLETCDTCSGRGTEGGAPPAACAACGGVGQVRFSQGFFTVARTCPQCGGAGTVITAPCPECRGDGRVEKQRSVQVRIPAGVDSGARLRLNGEGEHGRRGGPPGDLYVVIVVDEHERFLRRGADVWSGELLTYPEAVFGTTLEVETLHGKASLEVPPGTTAGATFALRGRGIPRLDGSGRGDHMVEVDLAVPKPGELKEEETELLRRLAELGGKPVRERRVLDRVRHLFGQ